MDQDEYRKAVRREWLRLGTIVSIIGSQLGVIIHAAFRDEPVGIAAGLLVSLVSTVLFLVWSYKLFGVKGE
jgi:uncharacterized membrane protein YfcA